MQMDEFLLTQNIPELTQNIVLACHMTVRHYHAYVAMHDMASEWTNEETRSLVSVWGQANMQVELDGIKRNRTIFETISKELLSLLRCQLSKKKHILLLLSLFQICRHT